MSKLGITTTEALERRIDELCRENEQLRGQVASLIGRSFRTADKIDWLNTENSKLRELVLAFDWCTENFDIPNKCDQCPLSQSKALEPECEVRMRELGMEVDK